MDNLINKVKQWSMDRDLDLNEVWQPQFKKIVEEVMEYKEELMKSDKGYVDITDEMLEMGDILVTLIIMSQQRGYELNDCLDLAYHKIKDRKGETINGTFVKQEDLTSCPTGG